MSEISRVALFGKLNSLAYKAMEGATVFCKLRGNPYVELEHWLQQILQTQDSDVHRIVKHFELDPSRLAKDMTDALDRLPRGSTSISDLSSHLENAVERAWVYGTLMFGENRVRTGHLILGMLKTPSLRNALLNISKQFERVKADTLAEDFVKITGGSPEEHLGATDGSSLAAPGEASDAMAPAQMGKQEALKKFAVDLTDRARKGGMDPITGRDEEIRQIVDILMRRRQNNPILTGEAGVGKTAVVEGFALRIARGDVPPALKEVSLLSLDIGLLQAGASMKGEFENRLRQVIDEVQSSPKPIILFIDEAHTLIGAGGAAGTGDAANLLKPALARGTLKTIAATTWAEYKKYFEKDPALTRRFQVVQVAEPDEAKALLMVRGVASTLEKHHRVQLLDEALEAAVRLSHRYIPARQLPDKAVSLLDTACARVAISQHATPPEVEDCRRRIEALDTELEIIGREEAIGIYAATRRADAEEKIGGERERLVGLEERWTKEKGIVDRVLDLRSKLREGGKPVDANAANVTGAAAKSAGEQQAGAAAPAAADPKSAPPDAAAAAQPSAELTPEQRAALLTELHAAQDELRELQGESPLIMPSVDEQAVCSVVADWTGIPVGRMVKNEIETVLKLAEALNSRVIGQRHGLEMIAKRIQTSRAKLDNPNKPIGVFMLAGTSGVGKTETALALAEALYGGEQNVITINMSEFQEAHTVSTLKGAPPGYVGYGEGGILTEAVRRRPYSVVLLDEVEKAHPDVHEIFFQVFDKGWMEDGEGRYIDFKNTIILLTTNAGSDLIMSMCKDPELTPDPESLAKALRQPLLQVFPPALLGRLVVVPYYPLSDEMMASIVRLQLGRIQKRVQANHKIPLEYGEDVVKLIVSRCTGSVDSTIGIYLKVPARGSQEAWYWIIAGEDWSSVNGLNKRIEERLPEYYLLRTEKYWRYWLNRDGIDFGDLPPKVVDLYHKSLLIIRTQVDASGAIIAANDSDIATQARDTYSYLWPRDGALVAHALDAAGYPQITRRFFRLCAELITPEGYFLHKYNPDGSLASSWHPWIGADGEPQLPIQEDETALVIWALWQHFERYRDVEYITPLYAPLIKRAASWMAAYRDPVTGLPKPSYDLWEERRGVLTFTCSTVYAGLMAASNFTEGFGQAGLTDTYRRAAAEVKVGMDRYLYRQELGRFARMVTFTKKGMVENVDTTLDASLYAVAQFGTYDPSDERVVRTMQAIRDRLWCKTAVGGIARYENDYYHQVSQDLENVPGNPWFICTMWVAQWLIKRATRVEDLKEAVPLLEWVADRCLPSGVLAEQVHPYSNEPLSVAPLTWSHATLVQVVLDYLEKKTALDVCVSCNQSAHPFRHRKTNQL